MPTTPHERLRQIIRDARQNAARPDNAPAIARVILAEYRDAILGENEVHDHLLRAGLNAEIRRCLTRYLGDGAERTQARAQQLLLWPETVRQTVGQIDRERVWVPSREEFVELVPDAMSASEMREAGNHLLQHGADCIRRGRLLLRLADMTPATA